MKISWKKRKGIKKKKRKVGYQEKVYCGENQKIVIEEKRGKWTIGKKWKKWALDKKKKKKNKRIK